LIRIKKVTQQCRYGFRSKSAFNEVVHGSFLILAKCHFKHFGKYILINKTWGRNLNRFNEIRPVHFLIDRKDKFIILHVQIDDQKELDQKITLPA